MLNNICQKSQGELFFEPDSFIPATVFVLHVRMAKIWKFKMLFMYSQNEKRYGA